MILADTIQIYGGGPGSGCRGPNCGRKGDGKTNLDKTHEGPSWETRQRRWDAKEPVSLIDLHDKIGGNPLREKNDPLSSKRLMRFQDRALRQLADNIASHAKEIRDEETRKYAMHMAQLAHKKLDRAKDLEDENIVQALMRQEDVLMDLHTVLKHWKEGEALRLQAALYNLRNKL